MMNIVGTACLMFLIYLGTGWLGVPESHRIQVALWGGGILGVLGAIAGPLTKILPKAGSKPKFPLGRYTAGIQENDLRQTVGGLTNIYCRLVIAYVDAKNDATARIIDVQAFSVASTPDGEIVPYILEAYCELRQAKRNFRADRIVECALAEGTENDNEVTDLLATLRSAPRTERYDRKTAILLNVSKSEIILNYQFRAPAYKRVTVQPITVGYAETPDRETLHRTLLFIDGKVEGKIEIQRFKATRIQAAWQADTEEPIKNVAAFLLPMLSD